MKKLFITAAALLLSVGQINARNGFAIVIDPKSYDEARTEVDAYARAVENAHNMHVYTVVDRWGIPDSIRAALHALYIQKQDPIVGTVLIGDIPIAMVRDGQHMTSAFKMRQDNPRKESSVPSDRFYDDFDLRFSPLGHDDDAPYYYYSVTAESSQRLQPDIYSGRIRPTDVGGTSRYEKLRNYLRKATDAKKQLRCVNKMFFFSGHGYISESKVARMDEKPAWREHFPCLNDRTDRISYMDHSDMYPVKERLMNELMRQDLDFAILHHHGAPDTEYLTYSTNHPTVRQAKEFIRKACRNHIVEAKDNGKDWEKMRQTLKERFDLPDSWLADALDPKLRVQDSTEDMADDLHLEDFKAYGFTPNVPVVIIDACFCGSFHLDDCIANEYIFSQGKTVACVANTVNVLQDKWSDRLMGLINIGGCVGDIVRYACYLESHVIGDPTYRFTSDETLDIDRLIREDKPATWRKLLGSKHPELQSLAIEHLCRKGLMTSAQLRKIYETSPYDIVRLMALYKIVWFKDGNSLHVLKQATNDSYELLQRQSIRLIHDVGDLSLIPSLIRLCITNNTSDRVNYDATASLAIYPRKELVDEFARQFDSPAVAYLRKDTVRAMILQAINSPIDRVDKDIEDIADTTVETNWRKMAIRTLRNNMPHHYVPLLVEYLDNPDCTPELQVMLLEALGWHPLSHMADRARETALRISRDNKYAPNVRNEALKTYRRLNVQ